jgi:hypothetical protein
MWVMCGFLIWMYAIWIFSMGVLYRCCKWVMMDDKGRRARNALLLVFIIHESAVKSKG